MAIVLNAAQFADYHKRLAERFKPAVMRGIRAGAARAIPYLVQRTQTAPPANPAGIGTGGAVNTGAFVRSWRVLGDANGAVIVNVAPHAANVEHGRRAGSKFPPRSALVPWIKRKLLAKPAKGRRRKLLADTAPGPKTYADGRRRGDGRGRRGTGTDQQAESLYFPIARAIARRGLIGRKIISAPEAQAEILRLVTQEVVAELNREQGR